MNILISENRIRKIGFEEFNDNTNAKVFDLTGYTVLPGLIDAHVHVASPPTNLLTNEYADTHIGIFAKIQLEKMIQRGFTSIRDAGGELYGVASAINAGLIEGPRLFILEEH